MKLNLFNTVKNEERGCGQRSVIWLKRSQPCLNHLYVLSKTFSWRPLSLFSLWIIILLPSLLPFILPLINRCDRCLARLAWGLTAGFASHGGVTLSRGWPVPKVEAPWHPWHLPPLSDAVVKYPFLPASFLACPNSLSFYTPSCQLPFS